MLLGCIGLCLLVRLRATLTVVLTVSHRNRPDRSTYARLPCSFARSSLRC